MSIAALVETATHLSISFPVGTEIDIPSNAIGKVWTQALIRHLGERNRVDIHAPDQQANPSDLVTRFVFTFSDQTQIRLTLVEPANVQGKISKPRLRLAGNDSNTWRYIGTFAGNEGVLSQDTVTMLTALLNIKNYTARYQLSQQQSSK